MQQFCVWKNWNRFGKIENYNRQTIHSSHILFRRNYISVQTAKNGRNPFCATHQNLSPLYFPLALDCANQPIRQYNTVSSCPFRNSIQSAAFKLCHCYRCLFHSKIPKRLGICTILLLWKLLATHTHISLFTYFYDKHIKFFTHFWSTGCPHW